MAVAGSRTMKRLLAEATTDFSRLTSDVALARHPILCQIPPFQTNLHPTKPTMSDIALAKGEKFLEDNAKKEGVQVTPSGLQYLVITEGTGKSPKATDTVEVHYEGTLINGTVFDSSYRRKESIEFPLNRVIAGWTEGVQLMKEGAKFRFFIPSKLAYGPRGAGRDIGPNEALIFDVELIKVK